MQNPDLFAAFRAYDKNGDGTLTADELMGILLNPRTGTPMTLSDAEEFVAYADTNGDGVLDYAELCTALGQPPVLPMAVPVLPMATPVIPIAQVSAIQSGEQPKVKTTVCRYRGASAKSKKNKTQPEDMDEDADADADFQRDEARRKKRVRASADGAKGTKKRAKEEDAGESDETVSRTRKKKRKKN